MSTHGTNEGPIMTSVVASVAQWIARQTSNLKVVGSTPIRGVLLRIR